MSIPDHRPFGQELAAAVASLLEAGHQLAEGHRDYCGMGLAVQQGQYRYAEVWDGQMQDLGSLQTMSGVQALSFPDKDSFISWLAGQSDHSLSRREMKDAFYHGNQTITQRRLIDFVAQFQGTEQVCLSRWKNLWQAIPAQGDGADWFGGLVGAWSEPHRHYHNLVHLNECLLLLDQCSDLAAQPVALEMALWFHDAIYDPQAGCDNEALSASFALDVLQDGNVSPPFASHVSSLIHLTKKHLPDATPDAALICDIDLAILGQDEGRFQEYERAIRREYEWVPLAEYIEGRRRILAGFLNRPRIYSTPSFQDRYEEIARKNLQASLQRLNQGRLP
ncbi:putative metal-dependent HD superfamily phosphohydrolase [Prosthecobacter fusiformis]|uniref:Putative metal-dependent HD superfamily phosphohydrolase n=1 Tax=Prosthecobacter fusiformis TaxID=48464 RepID=A0A4R7RZN6_9BACT|nr:hypothetical protein [Prosthecobacter fusiformis]TDU70879.1 putative metal-dependent HD superfamily phosphohydrolase [Prosthecobacter fusiformis]